MKWSMFILLVSATVLLSGEANENDICIDYRFYMRTIRRLAEADVRLPPVGGSSMMQSRNISKTAEKGQIMMEIIKEIVKVTNKSLDELRNIDTFNEAFEETVRDMYDPELDCSRLTNHKYRTADGSCNNLDNPTWGMAFRRQRRHLRPMYSDGISHPRMFSVDGTMLPSTRKVSNLLHRPEKPKRRDWKSTVMVMAYGQFLDHDLISTPKVTETDGSDINCCEQFRAYNQILTGPLSSCFPIEIPTDDPHFSQYGIDCMNFVRSSPTLCPNCKLCLREQMNAHSSYIDASNVYGKNLQQQRELRSFRKGQLQNALGMLPETSNHGLCRGERPEVEHCFMAGDERVNTIPNLSSLHTLFVKEHNRLAGKLSDINPHWNDETLFQETRKIVAAQQQKITYGEYLPVILGEETMDKYELHLSQNAYQTIYDPKTDATITNSFGAASFRFGHSAIPNLQKALTSNYDTNATIKIEDTFHNPHFMHVYKEGIARWLVHDQATQTDGTFQKGIQDRLFPGTGHTSLDLVALNIQRGRDHGLPPYNYWREFCALNKITEKEFEMPGTPFADLTTKASDKFRKVYKHADDIDLYSGAVLENHVLGSQVGPTFACLLGMEFQSLKRGDRFFFENQPEPKKTMIGFTEDQVLSIKRQSFSKIICTNTGTPEIQQNAFRPTCPETNPMAKCEDLDDIDINLWRERSKRSKES